jgi:hypothetical protein
LMVALLITGTCPYALEDANTGSMARTTTVAGNDLRNSPT